MKKRRRYRSLGGSTPPIHLERKTVKTILGFLTLAFSTLLIVSLFTNTGALVLLRENFYKIFGIGIIIIPIIIIACALPLLSIRTRISKLNVIFGLFASMLTVIGLSDPFSPDAAGLLGQNLWSQISSFITPPGAFFTLLFGFLISLVVTANTSIEDALETLKNTQKKITGSIGFIKSKIFPKQTPKFASELQTGSSRYHLPFGGNKNLSPRTKMTENPDLGSSVVVNSPKGQMWNPPPLSLLGESHGAAANRGNVKKNADIIEKTLESFGITAKVAEVNNGPTITQYAIEIPMGTKLSKIVALQNDLALALATSTGNVRIEAPIPGKSLVGIEIPNISPEIVALKNILARESMRNSRSKLSIGLGLDVSGTAVISDIAKMPHVLIAGTTGSGKSVLINALIATILFRASPQEVKLILVDPKRVELTEYNNIPHLLTPVIVEPDKILSALRWATAEMDRRYKLFHDAQVRNIAGYNELSGFQALPYIVIIVDELNDLMQFAPVEIEDVIIRLAQMARATGIHLVVATQRPSVDVITGLIKANIPCRIAFNVSSMIDSRVILDQPGAEKLLGKGDMLYVPPEASKPVRIQGVYVSDTEIRNLISFIKRTGVEPEYTEEITQMPIGKIGRKGVSGDTGDKDELFQEAVRTVCQYDRASASLLQRRLKVGYARAARLIDELESEGIIGPGDGSKPRDVLVKNAEDYFAQTSQES